MLRIDALTVAFGGHRVFKDVSFEVQSGGVTALIGPNGAGKSTVVNTMTGALWPRAGTVSWDGTSLLGLSPQRIAEAGVARTFQNPRLFASLTVLENVMVGAHRTDHTSLFAAALSLPSSRRVERQLEERSMRALSAVGCGDLATTTAGELTAGQQRLVSVARAIAGSPKLLVLDEPAAGLDERETSVLAKDLASLASDGMSILVIEHHMDFVMSLAQHIVVLAGGHIIADGEPEAVRRDQAVIDAYLGGSDA